MVKNPTFCIVGLGKSGYYSAQMLASKKLKVKVTDNNVNKALKRRAKILENLGIEIELGKHDKKFYSDSSIYIVSPGIPPDNPVISYAKRENLPVISEIELAWMFCPSPIIAITGTDGKSTVATNIYYLLKRAGFKVELGGNIGIPFSKILPMLDKSYFVVLEISSFQLENIIYFHPFIGILLNLSFDHLDRYANYKSYVETKLKLFKNQTLDDYAILDTKINEIRKNLSHIKSNIISISSYKFPLSLNENQKFVYIVGEILRIDKNLISKSLKDFKHLAHRVELVTEINGVKFINDSKATTPHATNWALRMFDSNIILIAGGRDKNLDFSIVSSLVRKKVKELILLGEAKRKIKRQLAKVVRDIKEVNKLKEAIYYAYDIAKPSDVVLFSPMCSSFDMFKNYEERGNIFKKIVMNLKNNA